MKPWYKSRTIWLNVGFGMMVVGTEASKLAGVIGSPELSQAIQVGTMVLMVVGNIIMRMITDKPIGKEKR